MDAKIAKIVAGFALQSAISHRREVEALSTLYSNPGLESAQELYDKLAASSNHYDREVSTWLELMLTPSSFKPNPENLTNSMKKMEFLLYMLINRAGEARGHVNDWMNLIANAAEGVADGSWIDAKILKSSLRTLSLRIS